MTLIQNLQWRYATKNFNKDKKISQQELDQLKEAIRLSPSSYGLQLYKVLIIEDEKIREKLREASAGQSQITDASHLFVFCNYTEVKEEHIDEYARIMANIRDLPIESLAGFTGYVKGALAKKNKEEISVWTAKQTYIALTNLLNESAELKLDACPMEGFDAAQYDKILGLSAKGLSAAVVATVGYRSEADKYQNAQKVRKPQEMLFETI